MRLGDSGRRPATITGVFDSPVRRPASVTGVFGSPVRRPANVTRVFDSPGRRPARVTKHSDHFGRPPASVCTPGCSADAPPKQQADGRPRQAHRQAHRYAADSATDRYRWGCRFICDHLIGSCLGRLKLYAPGSADDFTTFRQVLWPLWTISQTGACSPPALPAFSSLFALRMPQPAREATPRGSIHSRTGRKRQGRESGKSIFAPITN